MKPSRTTHSQKEKEEGVLDYDSTILAAKTNPLHRIAHKPWMAPAVLFVLPVFEYRTTFFRKKGINRNPLP